MCLRPRNSFVLERHLETTGDICRQRPGLLAKLQIGGKVDQRGSHFHDAKAARPTDMGAMDAEKKMLWGAALGKGLQSHRLCIRSAHAGKITSERSRGHEGFLLQFFSKCSYEAMGLSAHVVPRRGFV